MKTKIIGVVLAVLLIGLILPGCVPKAELDECRDSVAEQAGQINELEVEKSELKERLAELEKESQSQNERIADLEEEIESLKASKKTGGKAAGIEVVFYPNPVPCKEGYWRWKVSFIEVNGVGVELDNITYERYGIGGHSLFNRRNFDSDWMKKNLGSSYLSAHSSKSFNCGFPCQVVEYAVFTVTGTDDNGNEITASGRVDFQPS